jgi:hypothetical protein
MRPVFGEVYDLINELQRECYSFAVCASKKFLDCDDIWDPDDERLFPSSSECAQLIYMRGQLKCSI